MANDQTVIVETGKCGLCGQTGTVELTAEQHARYTAYKAGQGSQYLQAVLPDVSEDDREQLLSGMHGACFDEEFGNEDEDPYEDEDNVNIYVGKHTLEVTYRRTDADDRDIYAWRLYGYRRGLRVLADGTMRTRPDNDPGAAGMLRLLCSYLITWHRRGLQPDPSLPKDTDALANWLGENMDELMRLYGWTDADFSIVNISPRNGAMTMDEQKKKQKKTAR